MGKINIVFENVPNIKLPKRKIKDFIIEISIIEDFNCGEINFIFCNDSYLLQINNQYLKHDFYTDIITFDYSGNKIISGDLFLSIERIKENSVIFGNSLLDEVIRVMVHGILHLMGYRDKTKGEKIVMRKKEDGYLEKFQQKA